MGAIGIPMLLYGLWRLIQELRPHNWLRVTGTVVRATIEEGRFQGGKFYTPIIGYEYSHNGQGFTSTRRNSTNYATGTRIVANRIISRYPAGSNVTVYVNPFHPAQSFLEYGTTPASWLPISYGILFTFLAVFLAVMK